MATPSVTRGLVRLFLLIYWKENPPDSKCWHSRNVADSRPETVAQDHLAINRDILVSR